MASKIQWTDETWNPVVGCSKVSPGCDNCYAERMAFRLAHMGQAKYNRTVYMGGGGWNGKTFCDEKALEIPLHWRKPRQIFVCSMGDLFHKSVPFEFIDKVMAIIALCPQHTFPVLTKRPERMLEYFTKEDEDGRTIEDHLDAGLMDGGYTGMAWPLPNLWLGVTAENQEQADKRIPILLQIPAAIRFVSIEPMLGAVNLRSIDTGNKWPFKSETAKLNALIGGTYSRRESNPLDTCSRFMDTDTPSLDWVIVGGESGPGARDCPVKNIRGIVNQCKPVGVPVFVKQIHRWVADGNKRILVKDIDYFPDDLQIREYPSIAN